MPLMDGMSKFPSPTTGTGLEPPTDIAMLTWLVTRFVEGPSSEAAARMLVMRITRVAPLAGASIGIPGQVID
jgi:hypothetical protein